MWKWLVIIGIGMSALSHAYTPVYKPELVDYTVTRLGRVAKFSGRVKATDTVVNFMIRCDLIGNSGTKIETYDQIIYETLHKGQSLSINFNIGYVDRQAHRVNCRVLSQGRP